MRNVLIAGVLAGFVQLAAAAGYTGKDIANEKDGRNWLAYGRTYSEQHWSPLKQINADNVSRLGLAWSLDLPGVHNGLTIPLAVDGIIYFTVDQSWVHAVDARTGRLLWRYDPEVYKVAGKKFRLSWGPRGIAYWEGKIYVGTLDGRLIALDASTGKPLWTQQTVPADTSANITGAPRVFNGKVIIGHGGADFGPIRGYATAYDANTGKQLWRFYAVPGDPAKGFENEAMEMAAKTWTGEWWKNGGGGTIWNAITYDPELNRVYLGTGNGQPHEWKVRSPGGGDNLFLCSIVALDADTGEYIWHYQTDPGNSWDYNSNMDITTATLQIDGRPRKVLMQAPKNGFLYVIDRETGKLISAEKIDYVNWAERIDLTTGRPVENPDARAGKVEVWPSATGAHSVMAQAFNPETNLLYIPVIRSGNGGPPERLVDVPDRDTTWLKAWDPIKQQQVWSVKTPGFWNGGLMTTSGNLVFEGMGDGTFNAFDARTGKLLWTFNAHFGISGAPITYEVDGKQYISVVAGWGGTGAAASGQMTAHYGWQSRIHTHRLLTFVLDGKAQLPPQPPPAVAVPIDDPSFVVDPQRVREGSAVYFRSMCLSCHGFVMIAGGMAPDLRASPVPLSAEAFKEVVQRGSLLSRGMPKYDELTDDELESLRHFIRQRARDTMPAAGTR
jgi:quinohemoprotein ethanol dehydrogenase